MNIQNTSDGEPNTENQDPDLKKQSKQVPLSSDEQLKKMKQFLDVLIAEIDKSKDSDISKSNS